VNGRIAVRSIDENRSGTPINYRTVVGTVSFCTIFTVASVCCVSACLCFHTTSDHQHVSRHSTLVTSVTSLLALWLDSALCTLPGSLSSDSRPPRPARARAPVAERGSLGSDPHARQCRRLSPPHSDPAPVTPGFTPSKTLATSLACRRRSCWAPLWGVTWRRTCPPSSSPPLCACRLRSPPLGETWPWTGAAEPDPAPPPVCTCRPRSGFLEHRIQNS
jgi:hypothetical protein